MRIQEQNSQDICDCGKGWLMVRFCHKSFPRQPRDVGSKAFVLHFSETQPVVSVDAVRIITYDASHDHLVSSRTAYISEHLGSISLLKRLLHCTMPTTTVHISCIQILEPRQGHFLSRIKMIKDRLRCLCCACSSNHLLLCRCDL